MDYTGKKIQLNKPAMRIIALAPHIVENTFSAGAIGKLVGVVEHSDFPSYAKTLPIVGGYNSYNIEKMLSLNPDLILAWRSGTPVSVYEKLRSFGIPVYIDEPKTLEDIVKSITDISVLAGTESQAEKAIRKFEVDLNLLESKKDKRDVPVFHQIWSNPLQTLNGDHIVSDIIRLCGGVNIFNDAKPIAPQVNIESVLRYNPQIIFSSASTSEIDWKSQWQKWPNLSAVKHNRLYDIHPDHIHRHSARILLGASVMCEVIDSM